MKAVVSDSQMQAFVRASLAIQRRTWLNPGPTIPQDFFQFPDPIAIVLSHHRSLEGGPEAIKALDDLIQLHELELANSLPRRTCAITESRRLASIAGASADPARIRAADRNIARQWRRCYSQLERVIEAAAGIFEADAPDAARQIREEFWLGCFPDLIGHEITPALLLSVDEIAADLDRDLLSVILAKRSEYFATRHQLLRKAVTDHVGDFMRIDDNEERRERLYLQPAGTSSLSVTQAQLDRCRLALQMQHQLKELLGTLDGLQRGKPVQQAHLALAQSGKLPLDTTEMEGYLTDVLAKYKSSEDGRLEPEPEAGKLGSAMSTFCASARCCSTSSSLGEHWVHALRRSSHGLGIAERMRLRSSCAKNCSRRARTESG